MRRSMKRVFGAAAALAVAAALALCGPAAYAAPAAPGDAQAEAAQADAVQPEPSQPESAQADGAQAEAARPDGAAAVSLSYSAHVSNIGWMGAVAGGGVAGTTGRGLPLEALRLVLSDASTGETLGADAISVEAHVAGIGWQPAVGNGGTAGTTGRARAVEALRVRLSDGLSERYTVWYRVHSAEFGWLGWACDGAEAGSAGYGRAAQAVQVAVLPKGDPAPGDTSTPFVDRSSEPPSVSYRAHVAGIGWQGAVSDGAVAGTTGQGRALEALSGSVSWYGHGSSSLEVRAHVSNLGWQGWTSGAAGTTGRALAVEALQFRLSGEAASSYDVWYRVHCADYGWLGWAKDGASAGTVGLAKAVQAVQVVLVPKGGAAPGPAGGAFRGAGERLSGSALSVSGSPVDWQHLFGRFREGQPRLPELDRRHVAQRRVDPEVVVPVHVVRELGPELARRAERLAVDELGLQYPVGRLVDGVVVGAALGRQRPLNAEGLEHQVDLGVVELAAAVRVEDLDVRDGEGERRERRLDQPGVLPGPGGVADDLPVVEVDEQADVVPRGPDAHVGQVAAYMGARRPAAEAARDDVGHVGLVDRPGVHLEPLPAVCADQAVLPHDAADPAPADGDARPLERRLYLARAVPALAGGVGRDHGRRGGVRRGGPVGPRAHGVVRRPRDAEEPALR